METPLTDMEGLNHRCELIKFLSFSGFELQISATQFNLIEHYIRLSIPPLRNNVFDALFQYFSYWLKPANDYYLVQTGTNQLLGLLSHLKEIIGAAVQKTLPTKLKEKIRIINNLIEVPEISTLISQYPEMNFIKINRLDYLFREKYKSELQAVVQVIYSLDAYISIGKVAAQNKLAFPEYSDTQNPDVSIKGLYHPLLNGAVPYDVDVSGLNNLCLLTGPNMAGKSTFLKSLGISIYISHLGFPVPAEKMKTAIYNGIVTTINLSDDMNRGHSHFYSEVKRVKDTALKLKEKKKLFVIFDELFRGTNVKDAFDASLLIIQAFAKINKSTFYISTHITEVAEKLYQLTNVDFKYFDSELMDDRPVYNYELKDGVSHERLGMSIVKNERIVEVLNSIAEE